MLISRPADRARRFLSALPPDALARVTPLIAPVMRIIPSPARPLPPDVDLIITSEAALPAAGPAPRGVWCVGTQTAQLVRAAGHTLRGTAPNAAALLELILKSHPTVPLLHLSGRHHRGALVEKLVEAGLTATRRVVYDQQPCDLPDTARAVIATTPRLIVPLFSPRSAVLLMAQLPERHGVTEIIAFSPEVRAAWTGPADWQLILPVPTADAMRDAVADCIAAGSAG
ncbi:MAG: uroporphyrinogen-III synthase [Celeribacter sp.]